MCEFCGCPEIEPFATLTSDHATLDLLAELFEQGRSPLDLDALRVIWQDHLATQGEVRALARSLDLSEVVRRETEDDETLETLLSRDAPDGRELRRALRSHADAWEFEVFPQIVLSADPDEIDDAASRAASSRA